MLYVLTTESEHVCASEFREITPVTFPWAGAWVSKYRKDQRSENWSGSYGFCGNWSVDAVNDSAKRAFMYKDWISVNGRIGKIFAQIGAGKLRQQPILQIITEYRHI